MWTKLFSPNLGTKFGVRILAVGIVALPILIFLSGDQLVEWINRLGEIDAYFVIPLGLLTFAVGVALNLIDLRDRR